MYKLELLDGNMSIRADHGVSFNKIGQLSVGESNEGDYIWTCLVDGELTNSKAGDQWLHLVHPIENGWVAIVHGGRVYCNVIDVGSDIFLKHIIEVYSDGSLKIDGQNYP